MNKKGQWWRGISNTIRSYARRRIERGGRILRGEESFTEGIRESTFIRWVLNMLFIFLIIGGISYITGYVMLGILVVLTFDFIRGGPVYRAIAWIFNILSKIPFIGSIFKLFIGSGVVRLILIIITLFFLLKIYIWPFVSPVIYNIVPSITRVIRGGQETSRKSFQILPDFASYAEQQKAIWDQSSTATETAPNVAFEITNLKSSPSSGALFSSTDILNGYRGSSIILTGVLKNVGDLDLKNVEYGFKLAPGQASTWDDDCHFSTLTSKQFDNFQQLALNWQGLVGKCLKLYPCEQAIFRDSSEEKIILDERERPSAEPVKGYKLGFMCKNTIDTFYKGQSYSLVCDNIYMRKMAKGETGTTCYVQAYAKALYHTRAILPVQIINGEYSILANVKKFTPSPITSRGGASLSIDAGEQPISSNQNKFALTVGVTNAGSGTINDIKSLYLWIPKEFGQCSGSIYDCTVTCDGEINNYEKTGDGWAGDEDDCKQMEDRGYILCKAIIPTKCYQTTSLTLKILQASTDGEKGEGICSYDEEHDVCTWPCLNLKNEEDKKVCTNIDTYYDLCEKKGIEEYTRYGCTLSIPDSITDDELRTTRLFRADVFYDYLVTGETVVRAEDSYHTADAGYE